MPKTHTFALDPTKRSANLFCEGVKVSICLFLRVVSIFQTTDNREMWRRTKKYHLPAAMDEVDLTMSDSEEAPSPPATAPAIPAEKAVSPAVVAGARGESADAWLHMGAFFRLDSPPIYRG